MAHKDPTLTVLLQGQKVQTVSLGDQVVTIGRSPDSLISLAGSQISRHHAELKAGAAGAILTDLGSTNGTFVQGKRLAPNQPVVLGHGANFQVGPYTVLFESGEAEQASPEQEQEHRDAGSSPGESADEAARPRPPDSSTAERVIPEVIKFLALPRRPTFTMPLANTPASSYLNDLPIIFYDGARTGNFLGRYLLIFESMWEPLEQREDHIGMYFNPRTCPALFLPWLASWLGTALNRNWSEARQRSFVAAAMELHRWRGTRYGVARIVELCVGAVPEISEDLAEPFVFRISVAIPNESDADPQLLHELIRQFKPAHVGYRLEVNP